MSLIEKIYVLGYSESQRRFCTETLDITLAKNLSAFLNGRHVDYIPLAIASTLSELHEIRTRLATERNYRIYDPQE
ncbi:hypothetical protein [Serratia sp. UGAL515B_01]|uniref:hypothetical protein n=1 Tax=Serratia sp. UGAL515B_01 TaxID=2986763 RepID=UPI0029552638|nr:hypothetical protein [Serratia sp. UGAL515B_01]WON77807.1 hypothetical protein OK023_03725 [Serratia sp. UGAL515B_01]